MCSPGSSRLFELKLWTRPERPSDWFVISSPATYRNALRHHSLDFVGSGFRIPHPCCRVVTCGGQALAIGTIGHSPDTLGVPAQGQQLLPAERVPDLRCAIRTCGGQEFAIGAVGCCPDIVG